MAKSNQPNTITANSKKSGPKPKPDSDLIKELRDVTKSNTLLVVGMDKEFIRFRFLTDELGSKWRDQFYGLKIRINQNSKVDELVIDGVNSIYKLINQMKENQEGDR